MVGERNVYRIPGEPDRYIKLEETHEESSVFGVVNDVTEDMQRRMQIESERDTDPLTRLYNRRGLSRRVGAHFGSGYRRYLRRGDDRP